MQGGNVDEKAGVRLLVVVQVLSLVEELMLEGAAEAGYGILGGAVGVVSKDSGRYNGGGDGWLGGRLDSGSGGSWVRADAGSSSRGSSLYTLMGVIVL